MHLGKYSISDDSVIGFWFVANKTMHCITNMGVVTLVDCVIYIYNQVTSTTESTKYGHYLVSSRKCLSCM